MATIKKTPVIRFKGFEEEWEEKELFETVDVIGTGKSSFISNEKSDKFSFPILGSTSIIGYDIDFDYSGDFLLTARVGANAGNLYRHTGNVKISDNTVFIKGENIEYLFYLLEKFSLKKLAFGTGQPLIKSSELAKLSLNFPFLLTEQTQIGTFFRKLDDLIRLQEQKLEKVSNLKKAMLEKMFPTANTDVPEIRFKGFIDKWEKKALSEIGEIVTGNTPPTGDRSNYNGGYLFVSPADIQNNRYIDSTITTLSAKGFSKGRILKAGAILFVSIGSTIGKVAQIKKDATTNQQINSVVPFDNYCYNFTFSLLENISRTIKKMAATQAVPIINKSSFSNVETVVPTNILEQQKIGQYFQNLDQLITQSQQKIERLKYLKQALLQKMFI